MSGNEPPRVTVAQALMIGGVLLIGFILIPNRLSLVLLLLALGGFGFVLNRLFNLVIGWVERRDNRKNNE